MVSGDELWSNVENADILVLKTILSSLSKEEREQLVNGHKKNNLYPIQYACVLGNVDLLDVLVEYSGDVNSRSSESYTALHHASASGFEDCFERLLKANASLLSTTMDQEFYVSGTAIYLSGGQTPLHVACANGNTEIVSSLLYWLSKNMTKDEAENILHLKDLDGNTGFDLALESKSYDICELLETNEAKRKQMCNNSLSWPPDPQFIEEKRTNTTKLKNQRISTNKKENERKQKELIRTTYKAIHKELVDKNLCGDDIMKFLLSDHIYNHFKTSTDFKSIATEVTPGVFIIPDFFSKTAVTALLEEIKNFLAADLPFERPNISIPYGMKLNPTGLFDNFLEHLLADIIQPISNEFFPTLPQFQSNYTFIKHYIYGKDTKPSTHIDPSELTFSVCLGEEFTGSEVYFHDVIHESCPGTSRQPHPKVCENCKAVLSHKIGQAVFHVGNHSHGVFELESGVRWQFILWCRRY